MSESFLVDINPNIEPKKYDLVLCKLTGIPIQELHNIENLEIKAYHANIDEISFTVPFYITENDGTQVENELFNLVDGSMMVLVNDAKYFVLTKPEIHTDEETGEIYKTILGFSREYELAQKMLVGYEYVSRKLYDITNSLDENGIPIGFLNLIEKNTSWRVGHVSSSLLSKYRSLNFSKATYLQAFNEVQKTFGCLFKYDTINKIIDVYEVNQLGRNQGLIISNYNFINSLSQTINHDEIKTRLKLRGKDNVSIQSINITGQNFIDNFDFFKSTKYMSQDLIDALNTYENYIGTKEGEFSGFLEQLETLNDNLSQKKIELTQLNTELKIIETNLDIAISDNQPTADLKVQQTAKMGEINTKQLEIDSITTQINTVNTNIKNLSSDINLNNHLTEEQAKELDPFIREDEYSDSNYTEDNLQELFEEGKKILAKISYPNLQFNVDVEDFLSLIEAQHVWDKFVLGDLVTLEHEELGFDYEVRLVGYIHNPHNNTLNLIFSNRDSVDDANIYLRDLLENITTTASTVDFNKFKWDKGEEAQSAFTQYINNQLDLSKQAILKAQGQKPVLDDRGLWLYKLNEYGTIDPRQIRAINNVLAMTKDNWNTVDVCITPDGVLANKIIGDIILGSNLKILGDNGILEILGNLLTIKDDQDKTRVLMGEYTSGKYGLLLKDSTGNTTMLDEDGMLQTWQEGRADNVASGKPILLNIFLPSNTKSVNQAILRFKRQNFRTYSTGVSTSSSTVGTSGSSSSSTTSGGGDHRHLVFNYEGTVSSSLYDSTSAYAFSLASSSGSNGTGFYIKSPGGTQQLYTRSASGDHIHGMSHTHSVTIPEHSHALAYGIYESTLPNNITIKINGIDRTSALGGGTGFTTDQSNLNITPYMVKGQWNTIELGSSTLGRIDTTVFIQALMGVS